MVTEIGKFLRSLRAKNDESLAAMSERLSLSPTMLSGIETGRKKAPKDFPAKLRATYELSDAGNEELLFAIADTNDAIKMELNGLSRSDRELVIQFAITFPRLDEEKKLAIREVLDDVPFGERGDRGIDVELADGSVKTLPSETVVLNPERADRCGYLYIAWFFSEDEPTGPIAAFQGNHVGPLYAYASTRSDLHKYGIPKPQFEDEAERIACSQEVSPLVKMMLEESRRVYSEVGRHESLRFSWVDVDNVFETSPRVGTSATVARFRSKA